MSVALLFEGNNELPGFHTVGQQDLLWEESVHINRDVQVFPLHVRHKSVFKATRTKKTFKIIINTYKAHMMWIFLQNMIIPNSQASDFKLLNSNFYPQFGLKVSGASCFLRTSTRNSCISSLKPSPLLLEKKPVRSLCSSSPKATLYKSDTPTNGS